MDNALFFTGYMYAFAAGFFGATFWMIVELQPGLASGNEADVRDMWTFKMIALRCLFGVGAATILYFFLQTSLLESSAWPDVTAVGFSGPTLEITDGYFQGSNFTLPNKDTALLIVWSFLAGYSQKYVPNLLSKTAQSNDF